ncbi:PREDICTED: pyroglutamylated RFamide peptide receptor-like [Priapulus caudatus]|uniref:Pyroglutamylated RFamide peptide receptor-like n=1 Tax=Priapulus caudatus TaxID=37621 RepID=A0ABM1EZD8_PRICU|nr:PREDICTED: pyroglutamylated RFamide peptide receptor-like [Priapulus caudatus]
MSVVAREFLEVFINTILYRTKGSNHHWHNSHNSLPHAANLNGHIFVSVIFISNVYTIRDDKDIGVTNYLVVNLCIADLMVAVTCMPVAVGRIVYRIWIFGLVLCKLTAYVQGVSICASVFTLTVMAFDRYVAIRHPMTVRKYITTRLIGRFIAVIWISSVVLASPLLVVQRIQTHELLSVSIDFCYEMWPSVEERRAYGLFVLIAVYLLPGFVVLATYALMGLRLWLVQDVHKEQQDAIAARLIKARRRIAKILVIISLLFVVCWLPYHLLQLVIDFSCDIYNARTQSYRRALPFALLFAHMYSAINPVIYCRLNKTFKLSIYRMMRCRPMEDDTRQVGAIDH